jgi:DNA adenine methylase
MFEIMRRCEAARARVLFVYNDVDAEVVNFFRVLREPELRARLLEALELTPYARQEYLECLRAPPTDDPMERARRFFVVREQSFGGHGKDKGQWQYHASGGWRKSGPARWLSAIGRLEAFGRALRRTQVECLDFADLLRRYNRPGVLLYCDPPYYPDARADRDLYRHEMTAERHRELAEILAGIAGMAAVSGYRCPEYDDWYAGWERHDLEVYCHLSSYGSARHFRNGTKPRRVESLWLNPAAARARRRGEQLRLDLSVASPPGNMV